MSPRPDPTSRANRFHAWAIALVWPFLSCACTTSAEDSAEQALVRLSLDYMDSILAGVAASTAAVASEFVTASRETSTVTPRQRALWRERYLVRDKTVLFQTWPGRLDSAPGYQADAAAYFSYQGENFDEQTWRQLEMFRTLTPVVRAAHRASPFSWSYVTTAQGLLLIYPFLTLNEAVNNESPTEQTYYQHADFENRSTGWTPPYLDLVGAGMMVTASTPAYEGDTLLGVVSHDITLTELSERVLRLLTRDVGGTAWLADESGLLIGVSDPDLAGELIEANRQAGEAVLYYRLPAKLHQARPGKARTSQTAWVNEVMEEVLTRTRAARDDGVIHFEHNDQLVFSGKSKATGWHLVWVTPSP
ncbi:MAG: hypothetical protein P8Y15_10565 [Gemmatimonadales bacterium]